MKQIRSYLLCTLFLSMIPAVYYADDFDDFSTDGMDIFADDPDMDGNTMPIDMSIKRLGPADIIGLLETYMIIDILQHNLYLRTNPLNTRSLLDYSIYFDQKLSYDCPWVVGAHAFYNQTSRAYFTCNSDNISSYMAVCDPELLADIQKIAPLLGNLDPVALIPLFKNFTVQDRRVGGMIHAARYFNKATLRFWLPLYYLERNFYATDAEREAIETVLGAITADEQANFQKQHLISDKFGFGDTRIEAGFVVRDHASTRIELGLYATIPTAVALYSGYLGSTFHECQARPLFDFETLINSVVESESAADKAAVKNNVLNFSLGALDMLAANLLDEKLGNGGHFGLGLYTQGQTGLHQFISRPWTENINLWSKIKLEYLFPAHENRFFINQVDPSCFSSRNFNDTDETVAADNLNFLNQQVVDRLYPYVLKTLVFPGIVFQWTGKACYEIKSWGSSLGLDLWCQGPENFGNIQCCEIPCQNLNNETAKLPVAAEGKILGEIFFKANRPTHQWIISFNGDYTFVSSGIGKDFSISANVEINF